MKTDASRFQHPLGAPYLCSKLPSTVPKGKRQTTEQAGSVTQTHPITGGAVLFNLISQMKKLGEKSSHEHFRWNPNSMYSPQRPLFPLQLCPFTALKEHMGFYVSTTTYIPEIYFRRHETSQNIPNRAAQHTDPAMTTLVHFGSNSSQPQVWWVHVIRKSLENSS